MFYYIYYIVCAILINTQFNYYHILSWHCIYTLLGCVMNYLKIYYSLIV